MDNILKYVSFVSNHVSKVKLDSSDSDLYTEYNDITLWFHQYTWDIDELGLFFSSTTMGIDKFHLCPRSDYTNSPFMFVKARSVISSQTRFDYRYAFQSVPILG